MEEWETDIAAPKKRCCYPKKKTFAIVVFIGVVIVGIAVGIAVFVDDGPDGSEPTPASTPTPTFVPDLNIVELDKLIANDGAPGDRFGFSVAVDGDTIVIGANGADNNGLQSGSAYVFARRTETVWALQAKLTASDETFDDNFGRSVAVDVDTIVIGADCDDAGGFDNGSAYVFIRTRSNWALQERLTANPGFIADHFGGSVAVDGDTIVIGASFDDDNGSASGGAFVFTRTGTIWALQGKLSASDGAAGNNLGRSVAVNGDTIGIGAWLDDDNGSYSGSAYVFTRTGTIWALQGKLTASDGASNDEFGGSVAVDGDTIVIGATFGSFVGSAYVFTRTGTSWALEEKLRVSDGAFGDDFGGSVAVNGDTIILALGLTATTVLIVAAPTFLLALELFGQCKESSLPVTELLVIFLEVESRSMETRLSLALGMTTTTVRIVAAPMFLILKPNLEV